MQYRFDCNKPITDQYIRNCLETAPANISVSRNPKPQPRPAESLAVTSIEERDIAAHKKTREAHKCDICAREFNRLSNLKRHLRIHTGETPFPCQHCGKKFSRLTNLKRHLRIHSGKKPYDCHYCSKKFNQSYHLNRHLRTHTGEKP